MMVTCRIVEHPVEVALFGVELHGPAMDITSRVGGTTFRTDSRHTEQHLGLLANLVQEGSRSDVRHIMSDLKLATGTDGLGMDNTLRDTLTREVSKRFDQLRVLHQDKTAAVAMARSTTQLHAGVVGRKGAALGKSVLVRHGGGEMV